LRDARAILPTDFLALASFDGLSLSNEAWPRERLGAGGADWRSAMLDQVLAVARGRRTWVSVQGQHLQGLVGARRRGGRQAWEIDYLLQAQDADVLTALLECALAGAGKAGAEKLFLRLEASCDLLPAVIDNGFAPYRREVLYAGTGSASTNGHGVQLRPVVPSDVYPLFGLYCRTTPESVRRSEAMTFGEWHAAQERRWMRNGVQLTSDGARGQLSAWVRAARLPQGVCVELLPEDEALDRLPALLSAAVSAVEGRGEPLFVLVADTDAGVRQRLEDLGLKPAQELVSLMRRTTRVQTLPKLTPAIANNAVGV
jgi:hypothetical protein